MSLDGRGVHGAPAVNIAAAAAMCPPAWPVVINPGLRLGLLRAAFCAWLLIG